MVPEVLTISHDHKNPFKVDFDDISWKNYVEHLKPIGLSIMLNTCNLSTEEKYTNFFNHLVCESMRLEQERNGKVREADLEEDPDDVNAGAGGDFPNSHSNRNHHGGGIELLPIGMYFRCNSWASFNISKRFHDLCLRARGLLIMSFY